VLNTKIREKQRKKETGTTKLLDPKIVISHKKEEERALRY